jgi:hypothetical protein
MGLHLQDVAPDDDLGARSLDALSGAPKRQVRACKLMDIG